MHIGLLVYPDCLPAGLFGFSDLLIAANLRSGQGCFEFSWLSELGREIRCVNGVSLQTRPLSEANPDAVLIPGAWRDEAMVDCKQDDALVEALGQLPENTRFWSYCTGVCLAARTGRLDGQQATTTWWLRERVGQRFPSVDWKPLRTLVFSARHGTASGVNGYLPLAESVLEETHGAAMVEDIRRHMVLPRPTAQHTAFDDLPLLIQRSTWLRKLIQQVEQIAAVDLNTSLLAKAMNTSPRTLQRRVYRESGYRCGQLSRLVKLNQVADRLISGGQPLAVIGHELGFADEASLRRSFRQMAGMTPGDYREQFSRRG